MTMPNTGTTPPPPPGSPGSGEAEATTTTTAPPPGDPPPPAPPAGDPPATPPAPTPPPDGDIDDEDASDGITTAGDVVHVPRSKFKELKARAARRERRTVMQQIETTLGAHGFKSLDEMAKAFAGIQSRIDTLTAERSIVTTPDPKNPPANAGAPAGAAPPAGTTTTAAAPPPSSTPDDGQRRYSDEAARERARRAREQQQRAISEAKAAADAAKAEAENARKELESYREIRSVEHALVRANVADIDYAVMKYREHVKALKPEDVEKFDLSAWLGELKKKSPFLFTAEVAAQPVTTGAPQTSPTPPGPAQTTAAATNGATDYRGMSPEEFKRKMSEQGIKI